MSDQGEPRSSPDLFRDTPVRYLGYANEVGEAFRSLIGNKWVNVSYGVATVYVLADTVHKSMSMYKIHHTRPDQVKKTVHVATDTLIWQMLASVVVPGFTVNRVCATSNYLLRRTTKLSGKNRTITVTGIGLAVIPFIIRPIDNFVDYFLNGTFRKLI